MYLKARFRGGAIALALVGLGLVSLGMATGGVSAVRLDGTRQRETMLNLGLEWIGFVFAALLLAAGVVRMMKRDSQSRVMLIVSGLGVVALGAWEILTIQDRAVAAALLAVPSVERAAAKAWLDQALRSGTIDISPDFGMYLVLIGGLYAILAGLLGYLRLAPRRRIVPTNPARYLPLPPVGSREPAAVVSAEQLHPAGQRCRECGAIIPSATNTCWFCGRVWAPSGSEE
jgi:hypothetical protein